MASPLQRVAMGRHLPPLGMPPPGARASRKKHGDMHPIHWKSYFESSEMIETKSGNFRVYFGGSSGPWVVTLHGGGFSALSWACFSKSVRDMVECRVMSMDLRGHGETTVTNEEDMSMDFLAGDVGEVVNNFLAKHGDPSDPIILMGHSMGGAIAVHVAHEKLIPSLAGLALIDIVEGSALEALSSMHSVLQSRPKTFSSIEHAIKWCITTGQVRNWESACVSMPGQIINLETGKLCAAEITGSEVLASPDSNETMEHFNLASSVEAIAEDEELSPSADGSVQDKIEKSPAGHCFKWRIDLSTTEKYWHGWFENLSDIFLDCPIPKLLILAGIDRLDKKMTVGQMQGKFQMQVLPHVGHVVHEDKPENVAEIIATFLTRFRMAEALAKFNKPFPSC
ncbi:unnamed protein product [Notodromas monacha]|uniref:Protein phosphatase methylesterase 1 n=1 Tax=Notodromas monacha TaxID=399045 RepID=A0A7R9BGK5_9CRUS|nr:unnamed protein product [Notodromas monacha]CAG0913726.1 unnamed protein product [Notodromas monacha]